MAQYGLPDGDDEKTNWQEGAGDADGDGFDELDEGHGAGRGSGSGPDDATTYWETTDEASNRIKTSLSAVTDPGVDTGHVLRTRNRKDASGGRQIDITSRLWRNLTVSFVVVTDTDVDNVWTTRGKDPLTAGEAGQIATFNAYNALSASTDAIETGGGTPRVGQESAHEFECPDVSGAGQPTQHRTQGVPTGSGSRDRPGKWN